MENQKPATQSDEIDLGQLFSKIGDFFKSIGVGAIRFLALLRRVPLENKLGFIFIICACVSFGFSYSNFIKKNYYESTMIISSNYLNKRLVDNTIAKLNLLAGEQNKKGLGKVLNIPDSMADNIAKFESKPFIEEKDVIELEVLKEQLKNAQANAKNEKIIDQVLNRIEIENRHAFEITVRTFNPTVITNLQVALVDFLRNNEYVKKRIEINKANLLNKKAKLTTESQKLDSLKRVIYADYKTVAKDNRQGQSAYNVVLGDAATNPMTVYARDLDIYNEIQSIDRQLYIQPDFEIVDGFTEFSEPASAGTLKITVISALIGVLIGYLTVAFVNFNKYLSSLG